MSPTPTPTPTPSDVDTGVRGASMISAVAAMSKEERRALLDDAFERCRIAQGDMVVALGEVDRGQEFRGEGATSTESWVAERYGLSPATARTLVHVGKKAWDVPYLVGSLCGGEITFDKMRAVADAATPETDRELSVQARACSVRELHEISRSTAAILAAADAAGTSPAEEGGRFLRFNDRNRTMTAQLPGDWYAETKARIEARANKVPTDGQTPWDERRADALMEILRSLPESDGKGAGHASGPAGAGSPYFVVAHVPLTALVEKSGQSTHLAGELEHAGLINAETVKRIACDATFAIGVDDAAGHTMYEGRARRFPSSAQRREVMRRDRRCRFPGCPNATFANVHHVVPWEPGGPTDLENLALLCLYHHNLVHSDGWSMTGNANDELTIIGPSERVMTSRPSTEWTRIAALPRAGPSG